MAHRARRGEYQARDDGSDFNDEDSIFAPRDAEDDGLLGKDDDVPFSWFEYTIFCLLGMAMLWAWNMFLAAAPYFAARFVQDEGIAANFESAILTISTVVGLVTMLALTHIQSSASYSYRISLALILNTVIFALLAISTTAFLGASPRQYLAFLLLMVGAASYASGLLQNGGYAFVAGFGRPEYMQAIVAGQGIAGVLPAIAQVVTVVMYAPARNADGGTFVSPYADSSSPSSTGGKSAFVYFMAAVGMSAFTLLAMLPLVKRHNAILELRLSDQMAESMASLAEAERASRKVVSLWHLFRKLRWMSLSIMIVFAATMFFPVLTTKILSVNPDAGILFQPFAFIPLAFFFWNLGDLSGRMLTLLPSFSLSRRPFALFVLSVLRIAELPLYLLCNLHGKGAAVPSDFFYLVVVQFLFGLTNGWLFSATMMASGEWAEEGEREVTGGFMGLCLAVGLAAGSVLSFTASGM